MRLYTAYNITQGELYALSLATFGIYGAFLLGELFVWRTMVWRKEVVLTSAFAGVSTVWMAWCFGEYVR